MMLRARQLPNHLLFFSLCFVYLWLAVEPNLIYHCFGTILPAAPLFATGRAFLMNCLAMPGGGIVYASGLLSQGYYYPWLGAAIIVLAALTLTELSRRHLALAGLMHSGGLTALPAVAFFLLYSRYKHPLPICLTVSLGLVLSLAFERLAFRRFATRVVEYCLMAAFAFWMGGSGALLVFASLTVIYAALLGKAWASTVLIPPVSIATIWVLSEYAFLIAPRPAFRILTPFEPSMTAGMDRFEMVSIFLLYGFVPLTVLLALVGTRVLGHLGQKTRGSPKAAGQRKMRTAKDRRRLSLAILRRPALASLPIVLMGFGLYVGHDGLRKPYVLSNYYSARRQWDKVLELGRRLPRGRSNIYVNHDILRALYHTGRLPYDMFRFPQNPQALLLTHEERPSDLTELKLADVFLELGHVNVAEKLASELVAGKDHLGVAIEKLAWISIIKEHPPTARIYLNAMERDLVRRGTARSLLRGLDDGFAPDRAAWIAAIRSRIRQEPDAITSTEPIDQTLTALLERNPRNKMAFEYLMACYLLTGKLDKIVENVSRLDDLGYQAIPTLYEEAILIYYAAQRQKPDLGRIKISPETVQRYQRFVHIRGAMQPQNQQATLNLLIREFGASYFFYFSFGQVGLI